MNAPSEPAHAQNVDSLTDSLHRLVVSTEPDHDPDVRSHEAASDPPNNSIYSMMSPKRQKSSTPARRTPGAFGAPRTPARSIITEKPLATPPSNALGSPMSRNGSETHSSGDTQQSLTQKPEHLLEVESTAASVAADYFRSELKLHDGDDAPRCATGTLVVLHDSCYGHRWSRPRTSKSTLSSIVERPERLLAGVLGVSAAYVRLGRRHNQNIDLRGERDVQVPFLIRKTSKSLPLLSSPVVTVHGSGWMEELKSMCDSAGSNLASTGKELGRQDVVLQNGTSSPKQKLHEGDLYLCPESLDAFEGALGGVCDAVDAVFGAGSTKRAFVCIRPPGHHCSLDLPSGFCWLNNVHVGIQYAAQTYGLTHAAIIDFDLHHGDGSQTIGWDLNAKAAKAPKGTAAAKKTAIGYFSLHDINSYPCEEGDVVKVQNASLCIESAHGQTIWNVHLQPWKTEAEFWNLYETRYRVLIERARAFLRSHSDRLRTTTNGPRPKAAIFISAGFDASEWETPHMQRHKVNVPTEFYARFTRDITAVSEEPETGANGRVVSVLEGGYSDRALMSGILSHISGLCSSEDLDMKGRSSHETDRNLAQAFSKIAVDPDETAMERVAGYDSRWWHPSCLSELENLVKPASVSSSKSVRQSSQTFLSPTQSSTAKVVDPSKVHRVAFPSNGTHLDQYKSAKPSSPEVGWAVAAHELSKRLVPTTRSTGSWKAEDLAMPRTKKERGSLSDVQTNLDPGARMQLRGRKVKTPNYVESNSDEDRKSRRSVSDAAVTQHVQSEAGSSRAPDGSSAALWSSSVPAVASVPVAKKPVPKKVLSRQPGIQVKKSGAPNGVTSALDADPAQPPVPQVAFTHGKAEESQATTISDQNQRGAAKQAEQEDVMDSLVSRVKKISLKMGPRPEGQAGRGKRTSAPRVVQVKEKKSPAARRAKAKVAAKTASVKSEGAEGPPGTADDGPGGAAASRSYASLRKPNTASPPKAAAHSSDRTPAVEVGVATDLSLPATATTLGIQAAPHIALAAAADPDFEAPGASATASIHVQESAGVDRAPSGAASPPGTASPAQLPRASPKRLPTFSPTGFIPFAEAPRPLGERSSASAAANDPGATGP